MKQTSPLILLLILTLAACRPAAPSLKECLFPGEYPDPSILRDGSDYYMTHSSFTYFPGLLIWHSTDLRHWKPVARPVETGDYSIFAPELCKVDGRFYLYYPTSQGVNYVVTADRIEGPWSEPVLLDVDGIDPGHVVDTDGNRYLYTNGGYVTPLKPNGLEAAGSREKVYEGWTYPEDWVTECMCLESPKLLRRGEWFYLVSAEGGTAGPATSHMCVVARSKSALGPWENSPYNPLIHTWSEEEPWWSKGHGTLIDDPDGNWYIVYHAYRKGYPGLGRHTLIESISWTEDGWPVPADADGSRWKQDGFLQDYDWLRDYDDPLLWARWEPGFEDGTLWVTTAVDESYEITADFIVPDGGSAGLYLFYNEQANFGLCDGQPRLTVRIRNERNRASLWVKDKDGRWMSVQENVDVSDLHHNRYGGFLALRPAYLLRGGATLASFRYVKLTPRQP